ncbi:MAG TPA: hypothetical protein PLV52_04565, partial [Candidatus Omnitrophota bacterium]|nr:hypothetical protein [Candidatus Omnitrophota bacterium]
MDDAEALAIWSAMQRIDGRRVMEVERLERSGHIKFARPGTAESQDLDRSRADFKIDDHGVIIFRPKLKADPLLLLRVINRKKTQLLLLALPVFDRSRFERIHGLFQNHPKVHSSYLGLLNITTGMPDLDEKLIRDMLARAFELSILIRAQLMSPKELTRKENQFLNAVTPVIEAHPECFSEIFSDTDSREMVIRTALANGLPIDGVSGVAYDADLAEIMARIPAKESPESPEAASKASPSASPDKKGEILSGIRKAEARDESAIKRLSGMVLNADAVNNVVDLFNSILPGEDLDTVLNTWVYTDGADSPVGFIHTKSEKESGYWRVVLSRVAVDK